MASVPGVDLGYGTTVELGDIGLPPDWFELVGVQDVTIPSIALENVDITHMKSPNRTREYIPGLKDTGEMEVPMLYAPGQPTDLLIAELFSTQEEKLLRITPASMDSPPFAITFRAYVSGIQRDMPVQGVMTQTVTFQLNAQV